MTTTTIRRMTMNMAAVLATILIACGCSPAASEPKIPNNPLTSMQLYVSTTGHIPDAYRQLEQSDRKNDASALEELAKQPAAIWLTGSQYDTTAVRDAMRLAAQHHTVPIFVLYNLPQRDVGAGQSGGGAANAKAYQDWIEAIWYSIGDARAIVIMEPDGVAAVADQHLAGQAAADRLEMIRQGIHMLAGHPNTYLYLDAGNAGWKQPETMIEPLKSAGVNQARGIAVNVSNFYPDGVSAQYGKDISDKLGGVGVVVDTSRNGKGHAPEGELSWCNPTDRAIGRKPEIGGSHELVQAWLWIKTPGDSDGACRPGEPPAGEFWLDYALSLVKNQKQ